MKKILAYVLMGLGVSTIVSCGPTTRSWNAYTTTLNPALYANQQPVTPEASYNDSVHAYESSSDRDYDIDTCRVCRGEGNTYLNFEKFSCPNCSGSGFTKSYPPSFNCTFLIRH